MSRDHSVIAVCVALAVSLAGPALLRPGGDEARFDYSRFLSRPPTWLLIGNSMLYSRVDPRRLSEHLQAPVEMIALGGSSPPHWYLAIKNVAARVDPPPERVFVFFRGRALTEPFASLEGIQRTNLLALSDGDEPELHAILASNRTLVDTVAERLRLIYPVVAEADRARESVGELAATPLAAGSWRLLAARLRLARLGAPETERLRVERERVRQRANAVFADANLRPGPAPVPVPARPRGSFGDEVGRSVLPSILRVAGARGLRLVFVRVRTRVPADADEIAHLTRLQSYLDEHGAAYLDMTTHPGVTPDWFGEGDHIAPTRLADYTDYFAGVARTVVGAR